MRVDLDGIARRVAAFPVRENRFGQIAGVAGGKVIWTRAADRRRARPRRPQGGARAARGLRLRHAARRDADRQGRRASRSPPTARRSSCAKASGCARSPPTEARRQRDAAATRRTRRRARAAGSTSSAARRRSSRAREWRQMLREVWRLQRDQFWVGRHVGRRLGRGLRALRAAARARGDARRALRPDLGDAGRARHVARLRDGRRPSQAAGGGARLPRRRPALRRRRRAATRSRASSRGDPWDAGADSPLNAVGVEAKVGRAHRRGQRPAGLARARRRRRCSCTRREPRSS